MKGIAAFSRKEASEILRTWRIWVLPGMLLFFALSGPAIAKYTPQIVVAVAGSQFKQFGLPPSRYQDSYAQWAKNLSQIVLFAIIIIYGGAVSSERKSGTAVLVLTKPLSRSAFILAKALVHAAFIVAAVLAGTAITWAGTALMFGQAPAGPLFTATLAWLAFGLLFLALMIFLSAWLNSQAGAAGIGLGVYALIAILTFSEKIEAYTPAALVNLPSTLAEGGSFGSAWPIATSLILAAALVALAAWAFGRKEL
jgi:ABC-type transport system involved in multi-copper enzyme maturation, permease component